MNFYPLSISYMYQRRYLWSGDVHRQTIARSKFKKSQPILINDPDQLPIDFSEH